MFSNELWQKSGVSTYSIDQSIRFNDDDSGRMGRTPGSASNRRTWTFSVWIKRGNLDSSGFKFIFSRAEASVAAYIGFYQDDFTYAAASGGVEINLITDRKFRDPSAWYHIVVVQDTTNAVASERVRIYVNGTRETSFSTETYPALNYQGYFNTTSLHDIGVSRPSGSISGYFDGYMAEIVFIDGQALDPSSFGEYNSSGIWIPKDVSDLTFGTNGFHIDGRDSADLGDDESGNGNDFTTSGLASHDQVLDSPTNNFAVFNPVMTNDADFEFSEGNLKLDMNTNKSWYVGAGASMSMSSGKWYWESYWNSGDSYTIWGILDTEQLHALAGSSGSTTIYDQNFNGIQPNTSGTNDKYRQNATTDDTGQGASPSNIWMFALDMDNKKMWLGYNGTWIGSGDPAGGTNETWGSSDIASSSYTPINQGYQISAHSILTYNFGQEGTFAGNTTAGGNSDGNGIGNFKYSVPSGYKALCTKNLGS